MEEVSSVKDLIQKIPSKTLARPRATTKWAVSMVILLLPFWKR